MSELGWGRYALNAAHEQADVLVQVCRREEDGRILAAEFERHGSQILSSGLRNLRRKVIGASRSFRDGTHDAAYAFGANESDVADERRLGQRIGVFGIAADELLGREQTPYTGVSATDLHQVLGMTASLQTFPNCLNKPRCRPNDVLRALDDDTVAGEESSDNRRPSIMQSLAPMSSPGSVSVDETVLTIVPRNNGRHDA